MIKKQTEELFSEMDKVSNILAKISQNFNVLSEHTVDWNGKTGMGGNV